MCSFKHLSRPTASYTWYAWFISVTCRVQMCDMAHSYEAWPMNMCDVSNSCLWHSSSMSITTSTRLRRLTASTHCNTIRCTATHCNALQHATTHCNTMQHTLTHLRSSKTLSLAAVSSASVYETWLVHMRHDSFITGKTRSFETWLIHVILRDISSAPANVYKHIHTYTRACKCWQVLSCPRHHLRARVYVYVCLYTWMHLRKPTK